MELFSTEVATGRTRRFPTMSYNVSAFAQESTGEHQDALVFNLHHRSEERILDYDERPVLTRVRDVFAHFHNLNLLALIDDLRVGRVAHQAWMIGDQLCPVAHGMPNGSHVQVLMALGQSADGQKGCRYAARHLGADQRGVAKFVRDWDDYDIKPGLLLAQLESLWLERLADAEVMQKLLVGIGSDPPSSHSYVAM